MVLLPAILFAKGYTFKKGAFIKGKIELIKIFTSEADANADYQKEMVAVQAKEEEKNKALSELLDVSASIYGIDYTNDVGVDNVRENIPFGTPWSMDDLEDHFGKRRGRWLARHEQLGFRK